MGDENPIRTLEDYSKPSHKGYRNTIALPVGNNVVPLRSDTIRLVQNGCSFRGLRSEDPNQHLKDFLKLVDSLDLDGSITTWEDLTTCSLAQFFPLGMTAKLRNDILMFQQHHGESLSEAWTRPNPQPQTLGTTFEARVRDYMTAHTERIERFENAIFKQREEINGRMTKMFGLWYRILRKGQIKDKNGQSRAREWKEDEKIEAKDVPILHGPTRAHLMGRGYSIGGFDVERIQWIKEMIDRFKGQD
ncbi:zinc finger, CCHC-type containing protein [Tanacetum coccineum]